MLLREHEGLGLFGDLAIRRGWEGDGSLMVVEVEDSTPEGQMMKAREPLSRADVERLRDICEEALS
jgi:hypothetical protein